MSTAEFETNYRALLDAYSMAKAQVSQLSMMVQQQQKQIDDLNKDLGHADTALKAKGDKKDAGAKKK